MSKAVSLPRKYSVILDRSCLRPQLLLPPSSFLLHSLHHVFHLIATPSLSIICCLSICTPSLTSRIDLACLSIQSFSYLLIVSNMGGESHPRIASSSYPKLVERPVGQRIKSIYTDRLHQFLDEGQYKSSGLKGCVPLLDPLQAVPGSLINT